jgi:hypothetical protein
MKGDKIFLFWEADREGASPPYISARDYNDVPKAIYHDGQKEDGKYLFILALTEKNLKTARDYCTFPNFSHRIVRETLEELNPVPVPVGVSVSDRIQTLSPERQEQLKKEIRVALLKSGVKFFPSMKLETLYGRLPDDIKSNYKLD